MISQEVSTTTETSCTWNEDAEIDFVLKEEDAPEPTTWKREDLLHRMMHGRLLNHQIRRARHIPGIVYAPAIFVGWVSKPAQSIASRIEKFKQRDNDN